MSLEENQIVPAVAPMPATVAEYIPFAHHGEWLKLSHEERDRVSERLAAFDEVRHAGKTTGALERVALVNAGREGWAFTTIRNLYYQWVRANYDWRTLRRAYSHKTSLPADFIAWLKYKALKEHRSRKQAVNKIYAAWRAGEPVAGYGTWREWFAATFPDRDVPRNFCGDYPPGWSVRNFYNYMPSKAQIKVATKGRAAVAGLLPKFQRDPSELRFLELITIDDFETDIMVRFGREIVQARGLMAIDVATRTRVAVGFKPRVTDDQGKKISVTSADMQMLLKSLFTKWGVPLDYPMTLLVENASASISEDFEAALDLHFMGQVRVERTGMLNYRSAANGFHERGGKPQEKGWIESYFNSWWNATGSLIGQKGSRYDNAPGDLKAKLKYVRQLAAYETTDAQWAQFRFPFLSFDEAVAAYELASDLLAERTDHDMIGFDTVQEWRLGPGDAPKPIEQMALVPAADQHRVEILPERKESPLERRAKLLAANQFVSVPKPVLALLAFAAKPVTVRNHHITFQHRGKGYTFAEGGAEATKKNGREVLAYFDEDSMEFLYCFSKEGGYLGAVRRFGANVSIKDTDAIAAVVAQLGDFLEKEITGPVEALLAPDRAAAEGDRAHNESRLIAWGLKHAEDRKKKPALAATLADDTYTASPAERFDAAHKTAAAIATIAKAQRAIVETDAAGLLAKRAKAAAEEVDLSSM